jgi:CubicO group peptidase (beta-lactamase class C family)
MPKQWLTQDIRLFSGAPQAANFADIASLYPVRYVHPSPRPQRWRRGGKLSLPDTYTFGDEQRPSAAFLRDTETCGLLVSLDGRLVVETYAGPMGPSTLWPCWSVTKSFVGLLVGIALERGLIADLETHVSDLAPILAGSAYERVALRDVLTMSSGARWYENYADPEADNRRHGRVHAEGGSLDAFAATLPREWSPGTRLRYNSIDTNVLGLVLRRVTKRSLAETLSEWLWTPMGAAHPAIFMIDGEGCEWAGAGLACTLRDRAKLGLLIARGGASGRRQVVPSEWIAASTTPSAPHLTSEGSTAAPFGYGYQWWLHDAAVAAIGIYNQYVWVDPTRRVVIAKASANRRYGASFNEAGYRDQEHMALFQSVAQHVLELA